MTGLMGPEEQVKILTEEVVLLKMQAQERYEQTKLTSEYLARAWQDRDHWRMIATILAKRVGRPKHLVGWSGKPRPKLHNPKGNRK
jgi:hypothetical protein